MHVWFWEKSMWTTYMICPVETRIRYQIPGNWNYRHLQAEKWVQEMNQLLSKSSKHSWPLNQRHVFYEKLEEIEI